MKYKVDVRVIRTIGNTKRAEWMHPIVEAETGLQAMHKAKAMYAHQGEVSAHGAVSVGEGESMPEPVTPQPEPVAVPVEPQPFTAADLVGIPEIGRPPEPDEMDAPKRKPGRPRKDAA